MGSDNRLPLTRGGDIVISIHAPRMGSDPPIRAKMTTSHIFQSTLPHGERLPFVLCCFPNRYYFNPRSRMGSDSISYFSTSVKCISIHAPAWGATPAINRMITSHDYFNPRSRMGSDKLCLCSALCYQNFNPRSRMGSDV